ncbi:MAG: hypothetical protein C5B50_05675 [Verrucomicrobia bacterium]|nr:MAG: hypothetical protein C5B50_05675 [Verrucomicrobiota bacterium]
MATTITFTNDKKFGSSNKPIANLVVHAPLSKLNFNALVDTGADYIVIPHGALVLGWKHPPKSTVSVATVGGTLPLTIAKGVTVEVEGQTFTTDIVFSPSITGKGALLGRVDLLGLFEVGMDNTQWLWK